MEKKANKNTVKKKDTLAAAIDKIVWADHKKAVTALNKLAKEGLAKNVKGLVAMLKQENDEATVKASFALEGLVMEAGNQEGSILPAELGKALAKALPAAKDDYALCIVLEEIRRLGMGEGALKALKPYLQREDPVFTYALMAVEALRDNEDMEDISNVLRQAIDACKDKDRRKLLLGAYLKTEGLEGYGEIEAGKDFLKGVFPAKIESRNQADVMLLDEMARLVDNLDFNLLHKALKSQSVLVRGLAQRVLSNAVATDFSDNNEAEEYLSNILYNEMCEVCGDFTSISLSRSLAAVSRRKSIWGFYALHALFQMYTIGDVSLQIGLVKLIADYNC
ncbi:MAG: hypothetical protein J5746_05975, partial [Victivallales bacterium]|nr:hypothetical protein [Victivallales bacterium]